MAKRDLRGKRYVYTWVDGLQFNLGLEKSRQSTLVVKEATTNGKKKLIALHGARVKASCLARKYSSS